jgi:hypothetical protein
MDFNTKDIKSFMYKHWWLYYSLFFLLLGLLVYVILMGNTWNNFHNRIANANNKLDKCCVEKNNFTNDLIRVREYDGEFGCLSFTLIWNSTDDLDLDVVDFKNNHIWYKQFCKSFDNKFSSTGGQLDIDLNAEIIDTNQPVENIYFKCTPPSGIYSARVIAFEKREEKPVNVKLIIREKGKVVKEVSGIILQQRNLLELIKYRYDADK